MPNVHILRICQKSILEDLGSLDDLPYELANTIANLYYHAFYNAVHLIRYRNHFGKWPVSFNQRPSLYGGIHACHTHRDILHAFRNEFKVVVDFIKEVRAIDKETHPRLYWFAVKFVLDSLKYDIRDVGKKTEIRRVIERQLKKPNVREVPDLVEILNV